MKSDVCFLKWTVGGTRTLRGSSRFVLHGRKEIITTWRAPKFWNFELNSKINLKSIIIPKFHERLSEQSVKIHMFTCSHVHQSLCVKNDDAAVSQEIFKNFLFIYIESIPYYTGPPHLLYGQVRTNNWSEQKVTEIIEMLSKEIIIY
jgi:hypothetical protein